MFDINIYFHGKHDERKNQIYDISRSMTVEKKGEERKKLSLIMFMLNQLRACHGALNQR